MGERRIPRLKQGGANQTSEETKPGGRRLRILIVEDDFFGAQQLASEIRRTGNSVIGPFPTMQLALPHIESSDAAILDVCLGNSVSFPVADALMCSGVPFLFLTAHDNRKVPERLSHVRVFAKPTTADSLLQALSMPVAEPGIGPGMGITTTEPVERVVNGLLDHARGVLPDRAAAERLVAAVLRDAITKAPKRSDGEETGPWLRRLLNDELRNRRRRHFH